MDRVRWLEFKTHVPDTDEATYIAIMEPGSAFPTGARIRIGRPEVRYDESQRRTASRIRGQCYEYV